MKDKEVCVALYGAIEIGYSHYQSVVYNDKIIQMSHKVFGFNMRSLGDIAIATKTADGSGILVADICLVPYWSYKSIERYYHSIGCCNIQAIALPTDSKKTYIVFHSTQPWTDSWPIVQEGTWSKNNMYIDNNKLLEKPCV